MKTPNRVSPQQTQKTRLPPSPRNAFDRKPFSRKRQHRTQTQISPPEPPLASPPHPPVLELPACSTVLPIPGPRRAVRRSRSCVVVLGWPFQLVFFSPMWPRCPMRLRKLRRREQLAIPKPDPRVLVLHDFLFGFFGHRRRRRLFPVRPPPASRRGRGIESKVRVGPGLRTRGGPSMRRQARADGLPEALLRG